MLFIIIALLVFITQTLFSYWWLIALDAFVATILVGKSAWKSFFSGFGAVVLVWGGTIYYINSQNDGILLGRIAELFSLPPNYLILITLFLGGLVGGLSALSGFYLKALWMKKKR